MYLFLFIYLLTCCSSRMTVLYWFATIIYHHALVKVTLLLMLLFIFRDILKFNFKGRPKEALSLSSCFDGPCFCILLYCIVNVNNES